MILTVAMLILLAMVVAGCTSGGAGETNPASPTDVTTMPTTEPSGETESTEEATIPATEPATELTEQTEVTEAPATEPETEPTVEAPTETPAEAPTEPPATEPPVTEPPAPEPTQRPTEPPVTEPPETKPTEPPATEPPATEPPVIEPPVTESPTEPAVEVTFTDVDEIVYATSTVNVRTGPGTDYAKAGSLNKGESVNRIGIGSNGWDKVLYNGKEAYVFSEYLSKTKPAQPQETQPGHKHSYTETVVPPTCEQEGYTVYACSCGKSYTDNTVPALGHDFYEYTVVLDDCDKAYTMTACHRCSYEQSGEYYPYVIDSVEVQNAIIKYINQYRAEQGSTRLTYLPGMTQVAEYRSVQLTTNFAHTTADIREAAAYYQYGEWIDMSEYGAEGYYRTNTQEAIGRGCTGNSADEIGYNFATGFRNSSGHWSYVGSSEYSYIGVGCTKSKGQWFCCIMVGRVNYG